jgi:hypothetical protein
VPSKVDNKPMVGSLHASATTATQKLLWSAGGTSGQGGARNAAWQMSRASLCCQCCLQARDSPLQCCGALVKDRELVLVNGAAHKQACCLPAVTLLCWPGLDKAPVVVLKLCCMLVPSPGGVQAHLTSHALHNLSACQCIQF